MHGFRSAVFLGVVLVAVGGAAAPTLVSYQGLLVDSQGAPQNGTVNLGFALFAAASGGAALWSETQSGVVVVDGVYSVNLGSNVPLTPSLLAGTERWLEVTVNGEAMAPRQRFTSAPYALRAGALDGPALPSLDALAGLPCNLGSAGVGTLQVSYAANQTGAVSLACVPSQSFTLTVSTVPGIGVIAASVGSNPAGINCTPQAGSDCSETYLAMTNVVLTRTTLAGCTYQWSGACSGNVQQCTVVMDAAKSVTLTTTCL